MPDAQPGAETPSMILRDWSEVRLFEAAVVLIAGLLVIAALKWLIPRAAARLPDRFRFYLLPWEPVLRLLILLFLFVYLVPFFIEPTTENLLAIAGATAVAFGFALKDYVSSLIAGVVALYERPYRAGDWVTIEGTYGEVQSLDLRTMRLLTPEDTAVTIPHSRMWSSAIQNANSGQRDLQCVADFYLHPDHDAAEVCRVLQDVALTSPYLQVARPVAVVAAEEPWGTRYRLKAYPIEGREQFRFLTDLTVRGKAALRRRGERFAAAPPVAG